MIDTQWPVFEVFHQQARGESHIHVGSIHAPDAEMALLLAKEQFARRQACVNLWVVPIAAITASKYEDSDMFEHASDKSYRESWGYKTPKTVHAPKGADKASKPARMASKGEGKASTEEGKGSAS